MGINTNEPGHEKMCLMLYANNKGADQPAHPRSLISAFIVRCLDSIISLGSAQAGLCLAWSETPEDTFCRVVAQIVLQPLYSTQKPWHEPRHDKTNKVSVRPAKTQISLGIRPVWSDYSLCAQWVAKDPSFLRADSEDSDQTGRMPRRIWVFAGRTLILLVLSCRGSYSSSQLYYIVKRVSVYLIQIWLVSVLCMRISRKVSLISNH